MSMDNKLFTCSKLDENFWKIDFRHRSSSEQVEVCDYYHFFEIKDIAYGNKFCITGRNTVVAYFAAGYYLSLWGAKEIYVEMPDSQRYLLLSQSEKTSETKPWLAMTDISHLSIISNPYSADGKWDQEVLQALKIPVKLPVSFNKNIPITITGKGSVLMYAALGISFGKNYSENIAKLRIPFLPYEVCFQKESISKEPLLGNKDGIVVGILGDPNSGKSVFSHSFYNTMKNCLGKWESIWLYDCDMASPTPDWYLKNAEKDSRESKIRQEIKTKWNRELEQKVAIDLHTMRTRLDILVADMPGGRHPKGEEDWIPQRIPDSSRASMMAECDAYIVLCRGGKDSIFNDWKAALEKYGLADRIIARFNTYLLPQETKTFHMNFVTCNEDGLYCADIHNLDRTVSKETIINTMTESCRTLIDYISYMPVARAAKAATVQAFLTSDRGTRYGAAVRVAATGEIITAGQYSSFNHSTNIHAEMNVLSHAAMRGQPDIDVLAIACSTNDLATPCGVCRQVMLEHATRTKRDFHVLLVPSTGWYQILKVSDLLPFSWKSLTISTNQTRENSIDESLFCEENCSVGSFYLEQKNIGNKTVNMVWDPYFLPGKGVAKIKYLLDDKLLQKIPHAFTEAPLYQRYLIDNNLNSMDYPGLYFYASKQISNNIKHPIPFSPESMRSSENNELYRFLKNRIFSYADIDCDNHVFLTCSRMLKIHTCASDYDLIVYADKQQIIKLRNRISKLLESGELNLNLDSSSVKLLEDSFIKKRSIYTEERYCETFSIGKNKFSLLYVHPENLISCSPRYAFENAPLFEGRRVLTGHIICADNAPYKRSESILLTDDKKQFRILCYHKVGTLLKPGDHISVSGNIYTDNQNNQTIMLSSFSTDKVIWFYD